MSTSNPGEERPDERLSAVDAYRDDSSGSSAKHPLNAASSSEPSGSGPGATDAPSSQPPSAPDGQDAERPSSSASGTAAPAKDPTLSGFGRSEARGAEPRENDTSLERSRRAGAEQLDLATAKIVKRYSNRKLYDTARSKYVTLDEIARMVKAGEDVRIIDNESKEDLTSVTLTQIIYEQEKAARRMPLGMLRSIIQTSGETLNDFFAGSVASAQKSVESSVTELRQSAQSIREAAARQLSELRESARRFFSREERRAEEFKRAAWISLDQLESRVADRVNQVRATRTAVEQHEVAVEEGQVPPSVDELLESNTHTLEHVNALRTRLMALSVLVDRLEQAARGTTPKDDEG